MANWMSQCADRYLGILYDSPIKNCTVSVCFRQTRSRSWYRKTDASQAARDICGFTAPVRFTQTRPSFYMSISEPEKQTIQENSWRFSQAWLFAMAIPLTESWTGRNPDIIFAGCWTHARRSFSDVLKALPKAAQKTQRIPWHMRYWSKSEPSIIWPMT